MEKILPELISIRRQFHQFPELSFQEHETTKLIATVLKEWGLQFHRFKNIDTGGYCDIGKGDFRSD
jgi:metal-dependent amidase/aminoacylase/carboxypeptidase family protein